MHRFLGQGPHFPYTAPTAATEKPSSKSGEYRGAGAGREQGPGQRSLTWGGGGFRSCPSPPSQEKPFREAAGLGQERLAASA